MNPNTILNIVEGLVKRGLVKREKKKHIVELSANVDEKNFKILKRIRNLSKVYESGVVDFLDEMFDSEAIVLIGSFSRGENVGDSDVDLVVISRKDYETISLGKFERRLNRKIHLIVVDYGKMSDEFYINLINGLILKGYIGKK